MVMNCELSMMWKEATEFSFKVLSPDFTETEEKNIVKLTGVGAVIVLVG